MTTSLSLRPTSYICRACRRKPFRWNHQRNYTASTATSNPSSDDIFDVALVGGGPVGLALLTAIRSHPATSHLRCALIESQSLQKQISWSLPPDKYSNRASSITPTNAGFLETIGAWRHLDLRRVQPYDEMQVWDGGNNSSMVFDWKAEAVKYNAPLRTVATMVENANLTRALLQRLEELGAQDSLHSDTKVESIDSGLDEQDGMNLSTWPVLTLQTNDHSGRTSRRRIAARLLIGADGINSPVRTFAGLNSYGWDYNRHGVVATLRLQPQASAPTPAAQTEEIDFDSALDQFLQDEPTTHTSSPATPTATTANNELPNSMPSNRATAFQRFLPACGGPIAILPLPNNFASLVWSTTPTIAAHLKTLSPSALVATINAALRLSEPDIKYLLSPSNLLSETTPNPHESELTWRLAHTTPPTIPGPIPLIASLQPSTLASFPLRLRNASSYTAPRTALAGDAAHTIHPLAGQGLNLGLRDAEALARTLATAAARGADIGDPMALEPYARERYGAALAVAGGVDLLHGLYGLGGGVGAVNELLGDGIVGGLLGKVRGLGMNIVAGGWIPGLKERIMRQAE